MKGIQGQPEQVITLSVAPCVPGGIGVETTGGCENGCIYCFSSCSNNQKFGRQEVVYFQNAAEILKQYLSTNKCSRVHLGYVSDFLGAPLDLRIKIYEVLREYDVPISILTKGLLTDTDIGFLKILDNRVTFMFDIGCEDDQWETNVISFRKRLLMVQKLIGYCNVNARIDPIIPTVNDNEEYFRTVAGALQEVGIKNIEMSFLFLTDPVESAVEEVFDDNMLAELYKYYESNEEEKLNSAVQWTGKANIDMEDIRYKIDWIPLPSPDTDYRKKVLSLFQTLGKEYDIKVRLCTCKNRSMADMIGMCSDARDTQAVKIREKIDTVLDKLWSEYNEGDGKTIKPPSMRRIVIAYQETYEKSNSKIKVRAKLKPILENKSYYKSHWDKDNCGMSWFVFKKK